MIKKLTRKIFCLRSKLGEFWWYSLMLFLACRLADLLNAFVGLWLVPKYVGNEELGAVIPLQQLANFFSIPLAVIACVFTKYINTYASKKEYGKVKSFIRDTLLISSLIFLLCIILAHILLPHIYTRLKILPGALSILILLSGFIGNISQLFCSVLQGLKKFGTLTAINIVSAPVRLISLVIAMPIRALSGYVLGQTTPPLTASIIAAETIRRELKKIPSDSSWRRDLGKILKYLIPIGINMSIGALFATITTTIYRQRLPEIESAAYYLLTRFAEIAGYIGSAMLIVLVPLASEAYEKGEEKTSVLSHAISGTLISTLFLSLIYKFCGGHIFSAVQTWSIYKDYVTLLPWITVTFGLGTIIGTTISYEMACRRFGCAFFILGFNFIVTTILASFTGFEFYRGILPDNMVDWMAINNLRSLERLTWFNLISALLQVAAISLLLIYRKSRRKRYDNKTINRQHN